jgi:mono/diheme cytochrome c family protein
MSPVSPGLRWTAVCVTAIVVLCGVISGVAETPSATPSTAQPTDVKQLYDMSCASCHGADGRGSGPAAVALSPAPRDFTLGIFKFRSTASGSLPTDDDLHRAIAQGLPGTSMLAWKGILTDAQIRALAVYVKHFSPRFAAEVPTPVKASAPPASSPDRLAKGKQAYGALACGACHGADGTGAGAVAAGLKDDWGHDVPAADLTEAWTFRGGGTATDIYLRLKTGINGTPMPSFADTASDQDLWDVANDVVTMGRKPVWKMNADEIKALYDRQAKRAAANPVQRGRVLVETLDCAHCHSPADADGHVLPGMKYAGGLKMRLVVWGDFVTANLTSDNETGLGRYTDEDIKRAFTRGIKHDQTRMLPFPMGWPAFAHLTADDQNAVVAFLRTIPPVKNKIPPPSKPGFFAYLSAKFQMLIGGKDFPIVAFAGNAGSAATERAATK